MRLLQCAEAKQDESTKRALIMSELNIQKFESDKKGKENKQMQRFIIFKCQRG